MITESLILFHESLRDLLQRLTGAMPPAIDVLLMAAAILVKRFEGGILHTIEFERYNSKPFP